MRGLAGPLRPLLSGLRASASDEDLKWLERLINVGISELYLDDLFLNPNIGPPPPQTPRQTRTDENHKLAERVCCS